jgi:hypothetical protein
MTRLALDLRAFAEALTRRAVRGGRLTLWRSGLPVSCMR